ncbi:acyltransferase family protein [Pseudomonas fluorescens]|uniref:acyltransferase family protein n=1 Tax=Pseudomonas fluorescens TaxID=294 RepID=UPI0012421612|nr:acyltransferase [Pseudomonas fluorescens]VVO85095.1 hypothetical protein PS898_02013 [Pseudomonas fluorescens]
MSRNWLGFQFLGFHEKNRDNNFTILRLALAWLVLFGHSFPLTGTGFDPLSKLIMPYTWIGGIAVGGFFAISGYLVSASITQRSMPDFIASRALRLYPAIFVYSLVAVLIIGPIAIKVPLSQYFAADPWQNLWNATLWDWIYNLPYAFSENPIPGSTNGSSWTLPVELRCYLLVLVFGFFGIYDSRIRANVALLGLLVVMRISYADVPVFGDNPRFEHPLTFFVIGCLFWVNRSWIPLNWPLAIFAVVGAILSTGSVWYLYAYVLAVTYVMFMIVYNLPHFDLDRYGDFSYGVYIYSWPISQLVWFEGQNAYVNTLLATLVVFPISFLSWRYIEKPALKLKKYLSHGSSRRAMPIAANELTSVAKVNR